MGKIQSLMKLMKSSVVSLRPASPALLLFHITTRCNMTCRHCADDIWGDPANDLSFKDIEKFSDNLGKIDAIALGGGEPFLRKDLVEICKLFAEKNNTGSISIPSNGFATENICATVERILVNCPGTTLNMMLSLDGFKEMHDSIRMPGSFDKVIETGHRLSELRKKYSNLTLCFNATIHTTNWQELPALAKFVKETFQVDLQFNVLSGNPRESELAVPPRNELEKTMDGIYAVHDVSPLMSKVNQIYRDVVVKTNFEKRQFVPCRAGSLVGVVDAKGEVSACPFHPPLGNIRDESFQAIWHSEAAKKQYRSIYKGSCTCNNDCFIRVSLMNYWKLPFFILQKFIKSNTD